MGVDFIGQVPAVQTLNSAIHRINHYPAHDPADKYLGTNYAIHWIDIHPMDSTIHLLNNWGTNLKRGVENDIFWSEIESGFLEPGGTPTTIIPMNTPPSPTRAQATLATSCLQATGLPGGFMVATQLQRSGIWISYVQSSG